MDIGLTLAQRLQECCEPAIGYEEVINIVRDYDMIAAFNSNMELMVKRGWGRGIKRNQQYSTRRVGLADSHSSRSRWWRITSVMG